MPKQLVKHQQQLIDLSLSELKFNHVAIKDKRTLHLLDFSVPQDMQDPNIIWNTASTDAATPKTIKYPLEMVPSLSHFARTLAALMVRRSGSSPCTSG